MLLYLPLELNCERKIVRDDRIVPDGKCYRFTGCKRFDSYFLV